VADRYAPDLEKAMSSSDASNDAATASPSPDNGAPPAPTPPAKNRTPAGSKRRWLPRFGDLSTTMTVAGTLLAVIGTLVGLLAYWQQRSDSASSDNSQATIVAIMNAQLDVQRQIATVQSNPVREGPTATVLAARQSQLFATQEILVQARSEAEATATAIAVRPAPRIAAGNTQAPGVPLVAECPRALLFGQTATCAIEAGEESDSYTLDLVANDQVQLRLVRVSGALAPSLSLADSTGNTVCNAADNQFVLIEVCAITTSGQHTLTVSDARQEQTGAYRLFAQRLNQAGLAQPLAFGVVTNGAIGAVGDLASFSIDGTINDQLLLRVVKSAGAFAPLVTVVDPNGRMVCRESNDTLAALTCALTESGSYSVFVDDYYRRSTGTYRVVIQRLNGPQNAPALTLGSAAQGALDGVGEFDTYSLSGTAGDTLALTLTRTSGAFAPYVRVFDPAGAQVCQSSDGAKALIAACTLQTNGVHAVVVDDYYVRQVGGYTLLAERASP
jgi:hypothetical protein